MGLALTVDVVEQNFKYFELAANAAYLDTVRARKYAYKLTE